MTLPSRPHESRTRPRSRAPASTPFEALDRPHGPRPAAARLHLVIDVEDPVPLAALLQRTDKLGRHRDEAAFALDGLEHHAGDLARVDVLLEEEVEAGERVLGGDAAI